ncbi:Ubiquitin-conjugating enzyme E2 32 [Sarracenia purpurea var. burkii]
MAKLFTVELPNVRTALVALIAFMPTNPNGALGSLDYKKEDRRSLAIKSRESAPRFGNPERQKLIDEIHEHMLKAPPVPQLSPPQVSEEHSTDERSQSHQDGGVVVAGEEGLTNPAVDDTIVEEQHEAPLNVNPRPRQVPSGPSSEQLLLQESGPRVQKQADDRLFNWAAVGLTIAILVLLLKKFIKASGYGAVFMDGS